MGTPVVYPQHKLRQNNGTAVVDYDTDTIKVMIVTSAYTYSAAHDFKDDITNEVSGTNYTAGGTAVAGVTLASLVTVSVSDPVPIVTVADVVVE